MTKGTLLVVCIAALGACTGDEEPRCEDPKYGNGVCDIPTSCAEPDIDCFATFETQEEAQAWYASTELAAMRPPLPATDPRFPRMQMLLEQGWEAYKSVNPVGDLASKKVQLVLAMQSSPNAFVTGKGSQTGLVVMVVPPLLDLGAPDDQVMSVVMHELEHAIGLHLHNAVAMGFNKYYVAPAGTEPFGFEQADNPMVRSLVESWIDKAETIGYLADTELRGMPMFGELSDVFYKRLAMQPSPAACTTAKSNLATIRTMILEARGLLDDGVTLSATAPTTINNAMSAIQTQCFAGFTPDAVDVAAAHFGVTRAVMLTQVPADLQPNVVGQPFVQGIYNWGIYLRTKMREIETQFQQMTGQPWSRARYYSTEEAADDSSVPVLRAMGLAPDGGSLMLPRLRPGLEAMCRPLVDGNQPIPYGDDLTDSHHSLCWRAGHIHALAASGRSRPAAPLVLHPRTPTIFTPKLKMYSH